MCDLTLWKCVCVWGGVLLQVCVEGCFQVNVDPAEGCVCVCACIRVCVQTLWQRQVILCPSRLVLMQ